MKRTYAFTSGLIILSICIIIFAHLLIYSGRDKISLEEEVVKGDKIYVDKLTINTLSFIDKLQWKGNINLNDGYDYKYSYKETDLHRQNPRGLGIGMQISYDAGFYLYHKYPEKFKETFKEVKERKDKKDGELVRL
ncbi:MAG: hypothetical protein GX219_10105, partial [Tissierellia bacterium]|nr:hypothetical protein [Tissierellia bacterium]